MKGDSACASKNTFRVRLYDWMKCRKTRNFEFVEIAFPHASSQQQQLKDSLYNACAAPSLRRNAPILTQSC